MHLLKKNPPSIFYCYQLLQFCQAAMLPAGVVGVEGDFHKGDAVVVADGTGREVARGLVAYSAKEAGLLIGHKSSEIEDLLGYCGADELIHRDDLVLS